MKNYLLTAILFWVLGIASYPYIKGYFAGDNHQYDTAGMDRLVESVQPIEAIDQWENKPQTEMGL